MLREQFAPGPSPTGGPPQPWGRTPTALETVVPLQGAGSVAVAGPSGTGVFFFTQSVEALVEAMETCERRRAEFDPQAIRAHVAAFDRRLFKQRMSALAMGALTGASS